MIAIPARAAFLGRIHLFRDLKEEDLFSVAGKMKEESFEAGRDVFKQGASADRFFILYQGRVKITQVRGKKTSDLATLVNSDYFGEEALLSSRKRSATVTAVEKTFLFSLSRDEFDPLLKKFHKLKTSFEVSITSRRLARQQNFKWLADDEVVYFVARKHEILLVRALSAPAFSLIFPVGLTVWYFVAGALSALALAIILFVVIAAWTIWNVIDWGNDYYIVTNQRVIWLEKIIGIYDSRQESPLTTVLSVSVETDVTGRMLDYGDVVIRTFTGKIPFSHVPHPYQASHMVEEQWARTKHFASRSEKEAMRNILRQKLGLTIDNKVAEPSMSEKVSFPSPYKRRWWTVIAANWFKLRTEAGGTITYRKHWIVLWRQVWQPTLLILLLIAGIITRVYTIWKTPGLTLFVSTGTYIDTTVLVLIFLILPLSVWWGYQYVDWGNDIFQVTTDQIIDLDRKPLGTQERRAAPLENILGTEYKRLGPMGYLFNFGTVEITVGGTKLTFQDVLDPAGVQADIDRRRAARMSKKREAEAAGERERMSDWLVSYHENAEEFREESNRPKPETKSE